LLQDKFILLKVGAERGNLNKFFINSLFFVGEENERINKIYMQ